MWPAFNDFNAIIFLRLPIFVVHIADSPSANVFFIQGMAGPALNLHTQCLRCFGAGHDADQFPFQCSTLFNAQPSVSDLLRFDPNHRPGLFQATGADSTLFDFSAVH
jgi:hypothetical protein